MSWAECGECHVVFNSDSAFDKHRIGFKSDDGWDWRCATPTEMAKRGLTQALNGRWGAYRAAELTHQEGHSTPDSEPTADRDESPGTPTLSVKRGGELWVVRGSG